MSSRILYYENIVKGEHTGKSKKLLFIWIGCVEPNIYHINIIEVLPSCWWITDHPHIRDISGSASRNDINIPSPANTFIHTSDCHRHIEKNETIPIRQITNANTIHIFRPGPTACQQRSWRKPDSWTYNFSWHYFDKIFSQKRCKGMLNRTEWRAFRTISYFDIPHIIVRKSPFRVLIWPISQCDKAHFVMRYRPFQPLKWAFSHDEMGLFAKRRNTS